MTELYLEEFDPYSSHKNYPPTVGRWPGRKNLSMTDSAVQDLEPPTPSSTSPTQTNRTHQKFREFSPLNRKNSIAMQNELRAFLNIHFPAGEGGYSQHYFLITPEANRLWKQVWRNDDNAGSGSGISTVDQIIALGCEDGVKRDFFAQISGQVEKIGTKRNGLSQSGSLDIRYLISNVMQIFSNLPLSARGSANPLRNPIMLASLLVPQLEAYLAINTNIRLLILTYSAEQFPTMIALRNLIGQDSFKVAGILDSLSSDPPSFGSPPQTPTSPRLTTNEASSSPPKHHFNRQTHANSLRTLQNHTSFHQALKSDSAVSFSRANYLLPSIATDTEISNFLSGIWMSLIEKSTFYTPEPEPAPTIVEKIIEKYIEKPPLPPTPVIPQSPLSYKRSQAKEPRDSKISRLTGGDVPSQPSPRMRGHDYAPSVTTTVRTTGSESVRWERKNDEAWDNFYIGDEDSEDDAYDRMIMGRSGAAKTAPNKPAPEKKRSSKKALKWLGLA